MIWRLFVSVFGSLSIWHWIVVLAFLLLVRRHPAWLSARFLARTAKPLPNAPPPRTMAGPPTTMRAVPSRAVRSPANGTISNARSVVVK